jgi:hypothetical protein
VLLFSDFNIKPTASYAYRIRLYLANPNYNLQETFAEADVDTTSRYILSDWSAFANVSVPDRTQVRIASVASDGADFPRLLNPLGPIRGTLILEYFDLAQGQALPHVEKTRVERGMLANISKKDAIQFINQGRTLEERVDINYPEEGLRTDACVMDFGGGKKLQKRTTRDAQGTPDLLVPSRALLLMPDGTMRITTTAPELFPAVPLLRQ